MSLLDALLLEPYRDPREVWIARRTDGVRGSGTLDDPYDGSARTGQALSATLVCDPSAFLVEVGAAHNLQVNASVTINNVKGPGEAWFNGTFTVAEVVSPTCIKLSKAGVPLAPPAVPYSFNGYISMSPFASVHIYWPVAKVTTGSTPHAIPSFGAVEIAGSTNGSQFNGTYAALGVDPAGLSFYVRLGFLPGGTTTSNCTAAKIRHLLDEVMRNTPPYSVIHLGPGTFETRGTSSIYIIPDQSDYSQLSVGWVLRAGQQLRGSGVDVTMLKLVLPVDEVNQTLAIAHQSNPAAPDAGVADLTVDCNADGHAAPHGTFPAPVTCGAIGLGGSFIRVQRVRAIGFCTQASAECFVMNVNRATDHPVPVGNVIEDCIIERPGRNNTHETTLMANAGNGYGNAKSPIVRNNYANCTYVHPISGARHSSQFVAIASITQQGTSDLFNLVTKRPHLREATNNIYIIGVGSGTPTLNGAFPIVQRMSETELVFRVAGTTTSLGGISGINVAGASIGTDFHAPAAISGTGCVTEGNTVFDCPEAYYTDTGSTRDAVVRNNYYSGVLRGVNFNFNLDAGGGFVNPSQKGATLDRGEVNGDVFGIFTIADGTPLLQLEVGELIRVQGALIVVGGIPSPLGEYYNIVASVTSVSSDRRQFVYELIQDPGSNADTPTGANPISYQSLTQVRRLYYETNTCELHPFDVSASNENLVPRAIQSIAFKEGPPYIFPACLFRDNVIQHVDHVPPALNANGSYLFAMRLSSYDKAMIDGNVVGFSTPGLIQHVFSGTVTAFNNRTRDGLLLPLWDDVLGGATGPYQRQDTVDDKVSEALLMALL